jgi:DNA-binding response OmpR family regulator
MERLLMPLFMHPEKKPLRKMKKLNRGKITIIDDDESTQQVIKIILEKAGYETDFSSTPNFLYKKTQADLPDLIIMDAILPGVDGREECKKLKGVNSTKHIPILLLSATYNLEQAALTSGANAFIEKPFRMRDLLDKIESLIS